MKQQVAELSVKTEDHLANAPVTLEDSHLGPGKTLHDHSTKHNDSSEGLKVKTVCFEHSFPLLNKTTFSIHLGRDVVV